MSSYLVKYNNAESAKTTPCATARSVLFEADQKIYDLQAEVERLRAIIKEHKEEAEASIPNQNLWNKAERQEVEG